MLLLAKGCCHWLRLGQTGQTIPLLRRGINFIAEVELFPPWGCRSLPACLGFQGDLMIYNICVNIFGGSWGGGGGGGGWSSVLSVKRWRQRVCGSPLGGRGSRWSRTTPQTPPPKNRWTRGTAGFFFFMFSRMSLEAVFRRFVCYDWFTTPVIGMCWFVFTHRQNLK